MNDEQLIPKAVLAFIDASMGPNQCTEDGVRAVIELVRAADALRPVPDGAVQALGARLTELLDDDQWNNLEPMLNALLPLQWVGAAREADADVYTELERAIRKFPTWPTDPLHAVAVVGEEVGELVKEVLQFTYEPHKTTWDEVRKEAVQAAAMAIRFCRSLDLYTATPGVQHLQLANWQTGFTSDLPVGIDYKIGGGEV